MKKRMMTVLSMVLVVGLIAAIPASTQILAGGSSNEAVAESNLPMVILVNRLELSEQQMADLYDLLSDLVAEREGAAERTAEFEQTMIEFSGSEEELDELLVAFREDQQVFAEALRLSLETSLDEVRDLLSINQGLVLQDEFPQLLGRAVLGAGPSSGRSQAMAQRMEKRMETSSVGGGEIMGRSAVGGRMQRQVQEDAAACTGTCEDEAVSDIQRGRMGGEMAQGMVSGRMTGQDMNDDFVTAMRGQIQQRLEQMSERVPEERFERLGERFGGVIEEFGTQMGHGSMADHSSNAIRLGQGRMEQRDASLEMQRMQSTQSGHGNLFGVLEQILDVLQLKLEAME